VPVPNAVFPSVGVELAPYRALLRGKVLNIGAGRRDISGFVDGELINQDIRWENEDRTHIQIYSPIHQVPVPDGHFDTILCNAVLEHVENPEEAMREMYRVLKKGGHLILAVPFLQPEHKVPTDFQRYTKDGLIRLATVHGFEVTEVRGLFTVYTTIYWILWEWLQLKKTMGYRLLRLMILPFFAWRAGKSKTYSDKLASGFQIIAVK
jgi:SAM-dependent methyltransferase